VQSNAVVKILPGGDNDQIINGAYNVPILNAGGVLDLNGQSEIVDGLSLTNGVLRNSANGSAAVLYIVGTPGAHPTNAITLNDVNNRFDVPLVDGILNIEGIVNGSGSLVKTGLGTLSLIQSNYYTGDTTITDGTLVLNSPFLATNSIVTVSTNATLGINGVLNLNFANSETNVVTALILGGVSKPAGVYNNGTDPLYITGTGSLQLVSATPPINPLPGPIQSGSTLALSWPTNLGWILQSQTNALNVGLVVNSNAWFDISGSSSVTSTNYTLNPTNPTVFFRLRLP
jgi:autotransporter-associated beta strand protein